nr:unnamed protein product [Callosobruchus analis]
MASTAVTETRVVQKIKKHKGNSDDWLNGRTKYKFLIWEFETQLIWRNIIFILVWHVIGIYTLMQYFLYIRTPAIFLFSKY